MSQVFDEKGNRIGVTLIEAGPCQVLDIKKKERDGYEAVQIGYEQMKEKKLKKTQKGKPFRYLREFKDDISKYNIGQKIDASLFKEGEKVQVSGISKGKGFSGVVKRWGFAGRPSSRGTKHEERTPGSVGASTPSRVVRGIKMAGRMGGERKTIKNLKLIKVDPEKNILALEGAVPGRRGTLLEVKAI